MIWSSHERIESIDRRHNALTNIAGRNAGADEEVAVLVGMGA